MRANSKLRAPGRSWLALLALIVLLAVTGYVVANRIQQHDRAADAARRAQVESVGVQGALADARAVVASLGSVLSGEPTRNERRFVNLTRGAAGSGGLIDMLWIQSVTRTERADYERRLGAPISSLVHSTHPAQTDVTRFVRAPLSAGYLPATFTSRTRPELRPGVDVSTWAALPGAIRDRANVFAVGSSLPGSLGGEPGFYLLEAADYGRGNGSHGFLTVFVPRGWLTRALASDPQRVALYLGGRRLEGGLAGPATASTRFQLLGRDWRIDVGRAPPTAWQSALPLIALTWPLAFALLSFVIVRGILSRRRAEAGFERMFQVSRDLLWIADLRGRFRRVNPAFERTMGYSNDELQSTPLENLVHPADLPSVRGALTQLAQGEEVVEFEARATRADGVVRRLELNARAISGEDAFYAAARDVTDRRRTERDLELLAQEQAALRRVATLVAQDVPPGEALEAVAREARRLLAANSVRLYRYEDEWSATVIASDADTDGVDGIPVGTVVRLEGDNVPGLVWRAKAPARIDGLDDAAGPLAETMRQMGLDTGAGAPIWVEGRLWGVLVAGWGKKAAAADETADPAETEGRLSEFTELVASAISNTEFRDGLRRLADEQLALRRVATLVAEGAPAADVFDVVAREAMRILDVSAVLLHRFGPGRECTVVGAGARDDAVIFRLGSTFPLDGPSVSARVFETGRPAQVDDYAGAEGTVAAMVRTTDIRSSIGVPITVDGALWGAMIVGTTGDPLPADTEDRLRQFTELAATAVSSANAREGLRRLAEEQAALRRVATLVAEVPASTELFAAVIDEASQLLKVPIISMARFEPDGTATVIAAPPGAAFAAGTNLALNGPSVIASIRETGLSARIEDYAGLDGEVATGLRTINAQSGFGSPIIVDGKVWGAIAAAVSDDSPAPDGAEARLLAFTELVATAISNTESRERVRGLAEEQATLRRVATLVAEGEADQLFERVAQEIIQLLDVPVVFVNRYGPGEVFTVLAAHARDGATLFPVGSTWPLDGPTVATEIFRTGQSARVDNYEVIEGTIASSVRSAGVVSSVGVPITVDGAVWGAIVVSTMSEPLPAGMEIQLRDFTDLIGTAISNAATRAQLVASRARLVEAGDEARRRVERNLHDGTQQRLIALGLDLQQIRALIPPIHDAAHSGFERVEHDLESVLEEVRELSRGLHPALLLRGGLSPALRALARRSPIKVNLKINVPERPASSIESATYYIVSEALTNAIKHSRASTISITIATDRSRAKLRAEIADDGVGGAEPSEGSGLMGAIDRVDALGGRLTIDSRGGNGTTISFELPLVASEEPFTGSVSS